MRVDKDYASFASHLEWYNYVHGEGYMPTDTAPAEAVEAMERYNKRIFPKKYPEEFKQLKSKFSTECVRVYLIAKGRQAPKGK